MLRAARERLPWVAATVALATFAVGLYVRRLTDVPLGVPWPPQVGGLAPQAHPLLAVSVLAFTAAVLLGPRVLDARLRPAGVAATLLAGTVVLRLALAAGRGGTGAWDRVFDAKRSFEAVNEYLPALPALDYGPRFFLDRFAELVPALPVHAAGHPPGLLLALHVLHLDTANRMAALCIAVGTLAIPLTYALGRAVTTEHIARVATLLFVLAPGALLFTATSPDAVYLTLGLAAAVDA
jgi:hypothetical protein